MNVRRVLPALAWCVCAWGQQYTIGTTAGNGTAGFAGDGAAPAAAQLNSPAGIIFDASGKIYFADQGNHRVRMISNGVVTTVAGNGTPGYNGDKGPATSANLFNPAGLALDSSGNLYIADSGNHVVRKVTSGTITTIAGSGFAGYSGDGGQATVSDMNAPNGLAFDAAGNLYIADSNNNLIRRVSTAGVITSYVGSGLTSNRINHPTGIAIDASGALFIADTNNRRIVKFAGNTLLVVAGNGSNGFSGDGGQATFATLNTPSGVAVDSSGNLYIADTSNSRIRKVTAAGIISTIAGQGRFAYSGDGGLATNASLNFPRGLAVNSTGVYIADTSNHALRLLTASLPTISSGGVLNAANFTAQISPGALATIFGTAFSNASATPAAPLPTTVGGVSVTVNGKEAPIQFLNPTQINFQTPWSTASGTAKIVVSVNGAPSNEASVTVRSAAPGLFVLSGAAIVQNFPDYSSNDDAHPIPAGGTIIAYLTGSGPVAPAVADGFATPNALVQATSPVSARVGDSDAAVAFVGLTPGFVGLAQANIVIPAGLAPGKYLLSVTINGETSNTGSISVK